MADKIKASKEDLGSFVAVVDGKDVTLDILATFDNEETGKSYVIYTDNSRDEDNNINVFASAYEKGAKEIKLQDLETEAEWKAAETVLEQIQEQLDRYAEEADAKD